MSVWVAHGLPCRPHDLARVVLFSLGRVNSMELIIEELSHKKQQAPFQSQRSKESAVYFFQSPEAQRLSVRRTPHSVFGACWASWARGDWHLRPRWGGHAKANANNQTQSGAANPIQCHFNVIIFILAWLCMALTCTHESMFAKFISHFWRVKFVRFLDNMWPCSWLPTELHPTVLTHLFRRTCHVFCERSVLQQDDDQERNLSIFHSFIVIFLCCVIVHKYSCTECVYW